MRDSTGLTYLRARYLSTGVARFITRDTWGGDYQSPLSLNKWGYVEGNPVNLVDPSGERPIGPLAPPNIPLDATVDGDYTGSEKIPPRFIMWFPSIDPLQLGAKGITRNTNAAQFIVDAWGNATNTGLCGQVAIAAILSVNTTVQEVVDDYVCALKNGTIIGGDTKTYNPNYTGAGELQQFIDKTYNDKIEVVFPLFWTQWAGIREYHWNTKPGKVHDMIRGWLSHNQYPIASVEIVSGNQYAARGGWIGNTSSKNKATHWVVITGISGQFDSNNPMSRWNWLRVYNPFDNQTEYYWYPRFMEAWRAGGNWAVVVRRK